MTEDIYSLRDAGLTYDEIAKRLSISRNVVSGVLYRKRHGLGTKSKGLNDWQPIETAPKGKPVLGEDGPLILVGWTKWPHVTIGSFSKGAGGMGPTWRDVYGQPMGATPTHWMPLPEPPND